MKDDEIFKIALEEDLILSDGTTPWVADYDLREHIKSFAKRIAEEEREACAKVCDDLDETCHGEDCPPCCCADEIRKRGEQ